MLLKLSSILAAIVAANSVTAYAVFAEGDGGNGDGGMTPGFDLKNYPYMAPGPDDVRSPCPGLNTLANHGILPRNGRNITTNAVLQAGVDGYNVQNDVLVLAAKVAMLTSTEHDNFSLDDLRMHENIEHDASLSRGDTYFGDNFSFNETLFAALIDASDPSLDTYNATTAGMAQKTRLAQSMAMNPQVINTNKEFVIRTRETSLYLGVMGNATTGVAKKEYVNIFFREERLPIAEGWTRSEVPITGKLLNHFAKEIITASEWPGPNSNHSVLVISPDGDTQDFHNSSLIGA